MRELAQRRNLVLRFRRLSLIRNGGDRLDDDEIKGDDDVNVISYPDLTLFLTLKSEIW